MKKRLFSKFKDYNYILDKILEEKNFSEDATNLLLNMIYKIEVSYKDYAQIKGVFQKQNEFIDEIIDIISKNCNQLFLIDPKKEEVRMLKEKNVLALTDEREKRIYAYPTELAILYGLIDIRPKYFYIPKKYYFLKQEFQNILVQGTILNKTEVIRNFNGWSWNFAEDANIDHVSNMIYQMIRILIDEDFLNAWESDTSPKVDYINEMKKELAEYYGEENSKRFYLSLARLVVAKSVTKNRSKVRDEFVRIVNAYENMKNKNEYIYKISSERKKIIAEIENKDMILNNKELMMAEFEKRNSKLPADRKILNISVLVDILQKEKNDCFKRMEQLNELVKPLNYASLKSELSEKIRIMSVVDENKNIRDYEIAFLKDAIKCLSYNIEKMSSKEEIIDIIYKIRYFRKIRVTEGEKVEDIPQLCNDISQILKYTITKGCKEKVFNIFCKDIEYNYQIIDVALNTAISNYEDIDIALKIEDGFLRVTVYDNEVIDKQEELSFTLTSKDLSIRQNKPVPMYVI